MYDPTWTGASVTAGSPVGPRWSSVPSRSASSRSATAVPPVVPLSTTLTSVSCGAMAVLVIVQVAVWPSVSVTEVAVDAAPPVHTQAEAV